MSQSLSQGAMRKQVLIAEDEQNLRKILSAMLKREGYQVHSVGDGQEAMEVLSDCHINMVITDLKMPKVGGMELLRHVSLEYPDIPVIIITAHGTVDAAVEGMKLGAFDFITKPFELDDILLVVRKALRHQELEALEFEMGSAEVGRFQIIGRTASMQALYQIIERVADSPSTVLITGESGTGKELIAKALHEQGSRAAKPFIKINCAAIPETLMESELFGYEKGAFTGAVTSKPGRFELAHQGSLFLDEIGEIAPEMQVKLLRIIQEGEFERVGGIKTMRVDVRLIAASNRDLHQEIAKGRFREDLFYRLNVVPLVLPPLRERLSDVPLLVEHFREKYNKRLSRSAQGMTRPAMEMLMRYTWPGNIRELENVMERTILFCDDPIIDVEHLPMELTRAQATVPEVATYPGGSLKEIVRETTIKLERNLIIQALRETGGNVTYAARKLKISRKSLQNKMKEFGLRDTPLE